ncbi:hypothetical protein HK405_012614, partial [Cladochytrium tenue]
AFCGLVGVAYSSTSTSTTTSGYAVTTGGSSASSARSAASTTSNSYAVYIAPTTTSAATRSRTLPPFLGGLDAVLFTMHRAVLTTMAVAAVAVASSSAVAAAGDVFISGVDVTAVIADLAPQTVTCMTSNVPGLSLPVTYDAALLLCSSLDTATQAAILACLASSNSPPSDVAMVRAVAFLSYVVLNYTVPEDTSTFNNDTLSSQSLLSANSSALPPTSAAVLATDVAPLAPLTPSPISTTDTADATEVASPVPTTSAAHLFVQGYDVTALIGKMSACSRACLTSVANTSLPVTWDDIPVICPNAQDLATGIKTCITQNGCSATEGTYIGLLPSFCKTLLQQYASSVLSAGGTLSFTPSDSSSSTTSTYSYVPFVPTTSSSLDISAASPRLGPNGPAAAAAPVLAAQILLLAALVVF